MLYKYSPSQSLLLEEIMNLITVRCNATYEGDSAYLLYLRDYFDTELCWLIKMVHQHRHEGHYVQR